MLLTKLVFGFIILTVSDLSFYDAILDQQNLNKEELIKRFSPYGFILILIIGSILEEFTFRGFISKMNRGVMLTIFGFFIYMISFFLQISVNGFFQLTFLLLAIISSVVIVLKKEKKQVLFSFSTSFLVIVSSLFFALVHLTNYSNSNLEWQEIVPLIISHFFTGLTFCWIRIKYSLLHSIVGHIFGNLFALI